MRFNPTYHFRIVFVWYYLRCIGGDLMGYLYIFIGGAIGAFCRYTLSYIPQWYRFPIGTFFANIVGAFFMGLLFSNSISLFHTHPYLKKGITTGGLGALTTFSTFQFELFHFLTGDEWLKGMLYLILSSLIGLSSCLLGLKLGANVS